MKAERRQISREEREAETQRRFEMKQENLDYQNPRQYSPVVLPGILSCLLCVLHSCRVV